MNKIEKHILRRLFRYTYIGRRHTAREEMKQGLPPHLKDMTIINDACKELIQKGYLIPHHVDRIALNPQKLKEIEEIIYS